MSSLISKGSLAAALALASLAHDADAFSAASPMARIKASSSSSRVASPAGTMSLAMSARDGSSTSSNDALGRRNILRLAGSFASAVAAQGSPAFAKVGDFAKQDFSGSGGDSQSGVRLSNSQVFYTVVISGLDENHLALCRASLIFSGVAWRGVAWRGVVWCGVAQCVADLAGGKTYFKADVIPLIFAAWQK
jgi:hypothetical protein